MLKNFPQRVRNILEQIQLYRGKELKYQHYKDTMAYVKGTSRVKEVSTTSNVTASTYIHKNNKKKIKEIQHHKKKIVLIFSNKKARTCQIYNLINNSN